MYEKAVLNGEKNSIIFSNIQVHADRGCMRIAVEVFEVQTRFINPSLFVRIRLFSYPIPVLFKSDPRILVDKIADTVEISR